MKKQIIKIAFIVGLFLSVRGIVFAADVNLTIRDGANIIYSGAVSLQPAGTIQLQGHDLDADSVLSVLNDADTASPDFAITDLQYNTTYQSFYLNCINAECANWQYTVNDTYPFMGMDKNILSGGENVYIYFGPQNKTILSSNDIKTNETLTVTAQKYDYQNNAWVTRTGVTVGLTQPNPNDPFSPIEVKTSPVDGDGKATFSAIPAGSYNVGIQEDYYFPTEALTVTTPPVHHSGGGGGGRTIDPDPALTPVTIEAKPVFDLKKAFEFLIAQQKEDGSFGESLYTDWAALAIASGNYQDQTTKLLKYFKESKIENTLLTDYERNAMALLTLGLNPYKTNGENYIKKIVNSFDGKQFGDVHEDNDDIFALIVLQNAGYGQSERIINNDISFILSAQNENGSWDESVDMTGASIEALSSFNQNEQVKNALTKAKEFLKQGQKDNGGWDNASSTSWVLEGILALSEKPEDWIKNGNNPLDYLATIQDTDGGIKNENIQNKIWETAYVTSALSGKTWNQIMQKFEKQKTIVASKIPKKITKKQLLTANVINAVTPAPTQAKTEAPNKGWFARLLENIFGF